MYLNYMYIFGIRQIGRIISIWYATLSHNQHHNRTHSILHILFLVSFFIETYIILYNIYQRNPQIDFDNLNRWPFHASTEKDFALYMGDFCCAKSAGHLFIFCGSFSIRMLGISAKKMLYSYTEKKLLVDG